MLVSVIIPALNEEQALPATLRSLRSLRGAHEVIVVDGGSQDATVARARQEGASVLHAARGRGTQMRAGAEKACGDALWFLHADTLVPIDALQAIWRALHDPAVAGGNFRLTFDGEGRAARQLTWLYPRLRMLGLCYGDSGIFVRRSAYDAVGGMRPYPLFEDLDLVRRLRRTGRFVHLDTSLITSSRRFERRNFGLVFAHWTLLQCLFWLGVPPARLARWYTASRGS